MDKAERRMPSLESEIRGILFSGPKTFEEISALIPGTDRAYLARQLSYYKQSGMLKIVKEKGNPNSPDYYALNK